MLTVANYQSSPEDWNVVDQTASPDEALLTPEQNDILDAVRTVTEEQLRDVVAVQNYLENNSSLKDGLKGPAVKDVQEILLFLDYDISFISSRTGQKVEELAAIDWDYGTTMVNAVKEFQRNNKDADGNALDVDGEVGKVTYEAMLVAANLKWGVSAAAATTGEETIATSRVETATAALTAATAADTAADAAAALAADTLTKVTTDAAREQGEHAAIDKEVTDTASVLATFSRNLGTAQDRLVLNNTALAAARTALTDAEWEVKDFDDAVIAVKAAEAAVTAQTLAVTEITDKIIAVEWSIASTQTSYDVAGANAGREQGDVETAQAELVGLNYTGDLSTLPELDDAQATATAARTAFTGLQTIATDARTAATTAKTAWENGPWYGSKSLKAAMDNANLAVNEAEWNLDETSAIEAEFILSVVQAQAKIEKESGEAQDATERLEGVETRIAGLRGQLATLETNLAWANTLATETESKLRLAQWEKVGETIAAVEARAAMASLNTALETAEKDAKDTIDNIVFLEGVVGRVGPELAVLEPKLAEAEIELAAANAAVIAAEAGDESGRVGVANADRQLREATGDLTEATEEHEYNEYYSSEHALAALEWVKNEIGRGAIKAIQQALIDAGADLGSTGADGVAGEITTTMVSANPDMALKALAAYIDTTDNASVETRVVSERPSDGDAIDAALDNLFSDDLDDLDAVLTQIAKEFTGKDIDANTRNLNAQYIALKLQSLGQENSPMAQSLMEKIMAEGKWHYENESNELNIRQSLVDGSGRFARHLASFSENFTGSYYKIGQTLQGRASRTRVENGMEQWVTGNASDVMQAIFGVDTDFIAHRMHMVTGQWVDGDADMSLELGGGIILENAYYDPTSGAIYATVAKWNGCEGNLVVIPVETFTPPVVIRTPTPTPTLTPTPTPTPNITLPPSVDLPPIPWIDVNCNGVQVPGEHIMKSHGYDVYLAEGRIFRVKNDIVESRSFGINEWVGYKPLTADMVKNNIWAIMQSGTISFLWIKMSNLWNHVGSTENVCSPIPTSDNWGGTWTWTAEASSSAGEWNADWGEWSAAVWNPGGF
jgi:peptidoglycan hydrolase-like protein with peptidoglycan-binding domain